MRTTLGTALAQEGVAPQLAQRIMRHRNYKTTQAHYTVLGLADTAKAINALPALGKPAGGYPNGGSGDRWARSAWRIAHDASPRARR